MSKHTPSSFEAIIISNTKNINLTISESPREYSNNINLEPIKMHVFMNGSEVSHELRISLFYNSKNIATEIGIQQTIRGTKVTHEFFVIDKEKVKPESELDIVLNRGDNQQKIIEYGIGVIKQMSDYYKAKEQVVYNSEW